MSGTQPDYALVDAAGDTIPVEEVVLTPNPQFYSYELLFASPLLLDLGDGSTATLVERRDGLVTGGATIAPADSVNSGMVGPFSPYLYSVFYPLGASAPPTFGEFDAYLPNSVALLPITGSNAAGTITLSTDGFAQDRASAFAQTTAATLYYGDGDGAVIAGPGGVVFTGDDTGVAFVSDGGRSTTVLGGDGANLLVSASADDELIGGAANDTVIALTGSDTIALGGGNDLIDLGTGRSTVVSFGQDTINGGSGADTISVSGGAQTLTPGAGGLAVDVNDPEQANITADGPLFVTLHSGKMAFTQNGASGSTFIDASSGAATIRAGAATETLYGASGASLQLIGASADNVFVANAPGANNGTVLFDGSQASGGNRFWAGSGNATLIGGTGNDVLVAGPGASTMTGGAGRNEFDVFASEAGPATRVTITDFDADGAADVLKLFGYGSSTLGAINAIGSTANNTGTVLTLNDGATLTLTGFARADLTSTDILLGPGPSNTAG